MIPMAIPRPDSIEKTSIRTKRHAAMKSCRAVAAACESREAAQFCSSDRIDLPLFRVFGYR
jgi:hypothetical protein